MSLITVRDLAIVTPRPLFRDLSFNLGAGDRIGLVAGNGAGKSTLLRCLAGAAPDAGAVSLARSLRIGHVEQDVPDALLPLTLHEAVRRALAPADRDRHAWRVDIVLEELGAPDDLRARPVGALSGGWQRLAMLARIWVTEPGALLLDEPTNHLDADNIARLEAWIVGPAARTPMLIASHDRAFLDAVTTHTLFLRPDASPLYAHPYSAARSLLADDDAALDRKHARDAKEVDRMRRGAAKLRNVGVNSGSDLLQKKSMFLRDRADRLERTLRPAPVDRAAPIRLDSRLTHAKVLASLRDVTIRAPDGRALFRIGKLDVRQGDRLVLLGRNGVGKSCLLALLHRAAAGSEAGVTLSPNAVIGRLDQGMAHLPPAITPHRLIAGRPAVGDAQATRLLAGAGIAIEAQARPIARLSPGQKARLALLALRLDTPNFYLLDEPTNHVDIAGQEQLETELLAQGATCVFVSHDRAFVHAVATRRLQIGEGGLVEIDPGGA